MDRKAVESNLGAKNRQMTWKKEVSNLISYVDNLLLSCRIIGVQKTQNTVDAVLCVFACTLTQ